MLTGGHSGEELRKRAEVDNLRMPKNCTAEWPSGEAKSYITNLNYIWILTQSISEELSTIQPLS